MRFKLKIAFILSIVGLGLTTSVLAATTNKYPTLKAYITNNTYQGFAPLSVDGITSMYTYTLDPGFSGAIGYGEQGTFTLVRQQAKTGSFSDFSATAKYGVANTSGTLSGCSFTITCKNVVQIQSGDTNYYYCMSTMASAATAPLSTTYNPRCVYRGLTNASAANNYVTQIYFEMNNP